MNHTNEVKAHVEHALPFKYEVGNAIGITGSVALILYYFVF